MFCTTDFDTGHNTKAQFQGYIYRNEAGRNAIRFQ